MECQLGEQGNGPGARLASEAVMFLYDSQQLWGFLTAPPGRPLLRGRADSFSGRSEGSCFFSRSSIVAECVFSLPSGCSASSPGPDSSGWNDRDVVSTPLKEHGHFHGSSIYCIYFHSYSPFKRLDGLPIPSPMAPTAIGRSDLVAKRPSGSILRKM